MSDQHDISLDLAASMTKAYRNAEINTTTASAFKKAAFDRLLQQDNCVGIRCYFALTTQESHPNNAGLLTLVLVGYDSSGNDLANGELAELAVLCPPDCSASNALNL